MCSKHKYKPPDNVYGILAAPPCTEFSGSGARWWKDKPIELLFEALELVDACMKIIEEASSVFWCMENPVGRLVKWMGKPLMYFNPCDYGDDYTKKTCLWGKFNIPEKNYVEPVFFTDTKGNRFSEMFFKTGGKSERTKKIRSITPPGFSWAFFEANR